jgi:hypothetical protein
VIIAVTEVEVDVPSGGCEEIDFVDLLGLFFDRKWTPGPQ